MLGTVVSTLQRDTNLILLIAPHLGLCPHPHFTDEETEAHQGHRASFYNQEATVAPLEAPDLPAAPSPVFPPHPVPVSMALNVLTLPFQGLPLDREVPEARVPSYSLIPVSVCSVFKPYFQNGEKKCSSISLIYNPWGYVCLKIQNILDFRKFTRYM